MVTVSKGDSYITLYPSDTLKISGGVDHAKEAPIIGRQWFSWAPFEDEHYRWIISPARTFFTSMRVTSRPLYNMHDSMQAMALMSILLLQGWHSLHKDTGEAHCAA